MTMHRFLYFIWWLNVKSNIIIFLKHTVDMGGQKRLLMVEWLASLINSFKKCYVMSNVNHYYSENYLFSNRLSCYHIFKNDYGWRYKLFWNIQLFKKYYETRSYYELSFVLSLRIFKFVNFVEVRFFIQNM